MANINDICRKERYFPVNKKYPDIGASKSTGHRVHSRQWIGRFDVVEQAPAGQNASGSACDERCVETDTGLAYS